MTTQTPTLAEFLLRAIAEDEAAAEMCAEMFPPPWDIADRGWRVRIYSSDVPDTGDHAEPGDIRTPVVMEVEPDRVIDDPVWLAERVAHIARHDPARVLAQCKAHRTIVEYATDQHTGGIEFDEILRALASIYADREGFDPRWAA